MNALQLLTRQLLQKFVAAAPKHQTKLRLHQSAALKRKFVCDDNKCCTEAPPSATCPQSTCCCDTSCPSNCGYCLAQSIACDPCKCEPKCPKPPFVSMWESSPYNCCDKRPTHLWDFPAECCPDCDIVRFDELYYRPSNKCRRYQRTWWECCPRWVPKRICSWCDAAPPEVQRRCPPPICSMGSCDPCHEKERLQCLMDIYKCCPRLRMPCCRLARCPPCCKKKKSPSCCTKFKCPFPSFSECCKSNDDMAIIPKRAPECSCLKKPMQCEINEWARYVNRNCLSIWPCQKDDCCCY